MRNLKKLDFGKTSLWESSIKIPEGKVFIFYCTKNYFFSKNHFAGTLITDLKADLYSYRSKNFTNIWNSAKNLPKQNVSFLQSNDVTNADKVFHHI